MQLGCEGIILQKFPKLNVAMHIIAMCWINDQVSTIIKHYLISLRHKLLVPAMYLEYCVKVQNLHILIPKTNALQRLQIECRNMKQDILKINTSECKCITFQQIQLNKSQQPVATLFLSAVCTNAYQVRFFQLMQTTSCSTCGRMTWHLYRTILLPIPRLT